MIGKTPLSYFSAVGLGSPDHMHEKFKFLVTQELT